MSVDWPAYTTGLHEPETSHQKVNCSKTPDIVAGETDQEKAQIILQPDGSLSFLILLIHPKARSVKNLSRLSLCIGRDFVDRFQSGLRPRPIKEDFGYGHWGIVESSGGVFFGSIGSIPR